MMLLSAIVTVTLFIVAVRLLKVAAPAASAVATAREATAAMVDGTLAAHDRGRVVRRAVRRLVGLSFDIVLRAAFAAVVPAATLYLFDALGLVSAAVATAFLLRPEVIAMSAAATVGAVLLWR